MDWSALKVVELKDELKKRGLPVSGKKAELVARLEEAGDEAQEGAPEVQPEPAADPEPGQGIEEEQAVDKEAALQDRKPEQAEVAQATEPPKEAPAQRQEPEAEPLSKPAGPASQTADQLAEESHLADPTEARADPKADQATETTAAPDEAASPQAVVEQPSEPSSSAQPPAAEPTLSTAPSRQAIVEHRSDDPTAPAVSSAPAQPNLTSAPSTQAVISGPSPAETAPTQPAQPAHSSPTASLAAPVHSAAQAGAAAASGQDAPSSTSIAAPPHADVPAARAASPALRPAPVASQAPAVGTPEPMAVDAPAKPGTISPEPAVTSPPVNAAIEAPGPAAATAAAAAAEPMSGVVPAELEEEAVDYGGFEVEPELPAPREGRQRRPGTPSGAAAGSQDVDMGEARAKRIKPNDDKRSAVPAPASSSRDRKREREKEGSQANAAGSKLAKANDGAAVQPAAGKRAPIPTYIRRDSATANGKPARPSGDAPSVEEIATKAAPAAASPALTTQSSADRRVSVFAGRLSGNFADQAGEPNKAPPSRVEATRALLIEGFKRPFTDKAALELLTQTGTVVGMKFGEHKAKAWVIMSTVAEAEATRHATWSLDWPRDNKASLRPRFIGEAEAAEVIGKDAMRTIANGSADVIKPAAIQPAPQAGQAAAGAAATAAAPTPATAAAAPNSGAAAAAAAAAADSAQEQHEIETMFKFTATLPKLFWQPLTDEQVQAREAAKAAKDAAAALKDKDTALAIAAAGQDRRERDQPAVPSKERTSRHDRHT